MKKLLSIIGIISIIVCILSFLFAALNWFGYYHILDGSADLFIRLHLRMIIGFVIGIVFAVLGIVCFIIRTKK